MALTKSACEMWTRVIGVNRLTSAYVGIAHDASRIPYG